MRTQKAIYNFSMSIIMQIILMVTGFLIPPLRIKVYGSDINGLLLSITNFLIYFKLVEAGLSAALMQALYSPLVDKHYGKINSVLAAAKKFYMQAGGLFTVIVCIFAVVFPSFTRGDIPDITVISLVLIIALGNITDFFFYNKYMVLLSADQKDYIVNIIQVLTAVLNTCITISLMSREMDIVVVSLCSTVAYLIKIFIIKWYVKREYSYVLFNSSPDNMAVDKRWDAFAHQIASLVVFNSPILIISVFLGFKAVSVYSIYNMILIAFGSVIGAISSGMLAAFGQVMANDSNEIFHKAYNSFETLYYMVTVWAYTCAFVLIIPFIKLYTAGINDAQYVDPILASLFICGNLLSNLRGPQNTLISAAGHFKETKFQAILEAAINIVISLLLVRYFSLYGVLIGMICSFSYRTIDIIFYCNRKILKRNPLLSFKRIFSNLCLGILAVVIINSVNFTDASSWASWLIYAISTAISVFLIIICGNLLTDRIAVEGIVQRIYSLYRNLLQKRIS